MQNLRGTTISQDQTYATIQGGAFGQELIEKLWEQNLTASKYITNRSSCSNEV